jgi:hypothetical protein
MWRGDEKVNLVDLKAGKYRREDFLSLSRDPKIPATRI